MSTALDSLDVALCRNLLAQAHALVKQHFPDTNLRTPWVYHFNRDHWEFHGPNEYYWHGRAANAYDARYKGWMAWLQSKGAIK